MISIFEIWTLLEPKTEYANLFSHCKQLWESWTDDKQEEVFLKIWSGEWGPRTALFRGPRRF